jgi:putative ABC transport system ATP-binding protein
VCVRECILRAAGVRRVFGSGEGAVQALKGADLQIRPGELVALRGRSGSGKTTLINLLGALDRPTAGEIFFEGVEIGGLSEGERNKLRRHRMGFVFQSFGLVPLMSALENVEWGLRVAGVPRKEWKERSLQALEWVGLSKRAGHRPFEMSGGEQQRCAIARAIAHRPVLILADEPTAELDSKMGLQVMKVFHELVRREGMTVVMTTHDPAIMEVADVVYGLEDGRIVEEI